MKTQCACAVLAMISVAATSAVVIPFEEREVVEDIIEDEVQDVLAVDFDGDGDTDVLSGSAVTNRVVWFESDGAALPVFTRRNISPAAPGLVAFGVADFDGDGDMDIATGTGSNNAVSWYEQTPGAMMSDPPIFVLHAIGTVGTISALRVADVDDDGDADVLFGGLTELGWFENDGEDPPVFTRRDITTTGLLPQAIRLADMNADGDLDIVRCGAVGEKLTWYESDGAQPPVFTERVITTTLTTPRSVAVADINRDQIDDLVVASGSEVALAWYESDGANPPVFTEHIVPETIPGADAVSVNDLDSNGFLDIVVASSSGNTIVWFDSDGSAMPAFTQRQVAAVMNSSPRDVFVGDIDGDSDLDVLAATLGDDRVVYYANELAPVRNLTLNQTYQTIAAALLEARDDDLITIAAFRFDAEPDLDFNGVGATLRSSGAVTQAAMGSYTLADGASITASLPQGFSFAGEVTLPIGAHAEFAGGDTDFALGSVLFVDPQATLVIDSSGTITNDGVFDLLGGSVLTDGSIENPGAIAMIQGQLAATSIDNAGTFSGSGDLFGDVTTSGMFTVIADSLIAGALTNDGTVTVQSGVLTILGTLTNNGTIIGDSGGSRGGSAGGFFVNGGMTLGASSSLELPAGDVVAVAGHFDSVIDDWMRFDLADAELRLNGLGNVQMVEAMSTDIGADSAGLVRGPGRFPLGSLVIGATPAVVELVDLRDNDGAGGAPGEAIYTRHLAVAPGAELRTSGVRVYYQTIDIQGSVDTPANLIALGASCTADLTADNAVGSPDLAVLLANWGQAGAGDLTFDGNVGSEDLAVLLAAWGACP